jgi:hypothetical protein
LKQIHFPRSLKIIDSYCFLSCNSLVETNFGADSRLQMIGDSMFSYFVLIRIEILNSVEQRHQYYFSPCNSLIEVSFDLDSSLRIVRGPVFSNCTHLEQVAIQPRSKLKQIGDSCF